jgi:Protein of unknown function (DUF4238)
MGMQNLFYIADFMRDHYDEFAQKLKNFIWMIGVNDSDTPIYTSDHPVVRFAHSSSNGLFSEGMEIVFPIDRKLVLIMLEPNYFQNFAHRDCKLMQLNPDEIVRFNTLQVAESFRFIFCSHDSFDLARQLCQDNPDLRLLERERIQGNTNTGEKQEGFADE